MLYRINYLLGIMAVLFGLLYLLFGIVGFSSDAPSVADRWMPFVLASIHVSVAVLLFWTSSRQRRVEQHRLERLLSLALQESSSVGVRDFAELAGISPAEAQEFLLWSSRRRRVVVVVGKGTTLRAWARHSLN
ncbi:MAG: hypothetical protein RML15_08365 [Bacteroidota bacterium]|nr:hypothetical protein [Candidatus Kapabacteria bacterium]MCS7302711.1 hypothetical protein [Candidatus Kapabacteria bacterium]MCX7937072.1 hypothetical protein [Chlorobiota bacterium]MDW8075171.1 hypothetical protein [Bacteroidota bacterium]MDW8272402.1 hypothetical protein [Bacteroidota bacterium]